jgi:hypothetical protein
MLNTRISSFKSTTLLVATSLLCCAGLGTAAQASRPADPDGPPTLHGPGKACIVIRHSGAHHAGHIGWAFETSKDYYTFGAVEDKSSDGSAGWWRWGSRTDMLSAFQHRGHPGGPYDAIKCIEVAQPNPDSARDVASTMPDRSKHYSLLTKNCLNATYDVIHAYGATRIPTPSGFDRAPNLYYKAFKGQETSLRR